MKILRLALLGALGGGSLALSVIILRDPSEQNNVNSFRSPEALRVDTPARFKSIESFSPKHPIDIDACLRRHEQSIIPKPETGIARYDIVQFAR